MATRRRLAAALPKADSLLSMVNIAFRALSSHLACTWLILLMTLRMK